jgi:hypothetical protein
MQPLLRPLSLGEILDRTFQFYRKDFVLFIGISAIPQLVVLVIRIFSVTIRGTGSIGIAAVAGLGLLVAAIASIVAAAISQAATSVAVSEMYLGRTTTIGTAYDRIRGRIGSMAGIVFGLGLLEGIGFICLIVPGIYLALIWALAIPAAVIEDLGFAECRDRSKLLTEGAKGRMFMIYLLVLVVTYGVLIGLGAVLGGVGVVVLGRGFLHSMAFQIGNQCLSFLGATLVGSLGMIAFTIAYYDQRVRKEGFDIQFMMQGNQQAAAAGGTV